MTLEPIRQLIQETNPSAPGSATRAWREGKLAELTNVGISSALVAGVIAAAFSWSTETVGSLYPEVKGIWFGALILVLTAINLATMQSTTLQRLGCTDSGIDRIYESLGFLNVQQVREPKKFQVLIWQMPLMLLNLSTSLVAIGLLLQLWKSFILTSQSLEVS
ncbi:unnamed protein product [Clonostachys byssicola]|uniref:Uncharacterized protein n=1 Tax=Clonostachys byssicola TaxID=160290 RepID=A0A9N9UL07_9HYPO|nr:unnamed protein product [Clonostachys byssicola]